VNDDLTWTTLARHSTSIILGGTGSIAVCRGRFREGGLIL
jgi:hypothetical protein